MFRAVTQSQSIAHKIQAGGTLLLLLVLLPILIPLLVLGLIIAVIERGILQARAWRRWCRHGTYVLLVTSDSPHWKDYIETELRPRLPESIIMLNWSERKRWNQRSLAVQLFRRFGGEREFNPLVLVFQPFRPIRVYRFWRAFRDYKHGKPERLKSVEAELFDHLSESGIIQSRAPRPTITPHDASLSREREDSID